MGLEFLAWGESAREAATIAREGGETIFIYKNFLYDSSHPTLSQYINILLKWKKTAADTG